MRLREESATVMEEGQMESNQEDKVKGENDQASKRKGINDDSQA
jgi:hypothetical protein